MDFETPRTGKSPLAPLYQGGKEAHQQKLNDPARAQEMLPPSSQTPATPMRGADNLGPPAQKAKENEDSQPPLWKRVWARFRGKT